MILLTTFDEPELALRAAAAGARGFLLKDASPEDLLEAITRVAAGETLLAPVPTDPVRARYAYRDQSEPTDTFSEREVVDPAPARRRLLQQGDRHGGVPVRGHGEELRVRHPRQARHPRLAPARCSRRSRCGSSERADNIGRHVACLPELKDSRDIMISGKPEWRDAEEALNSAMLQGLVAYLRNYRYALIAPLMLQVGDGQGGARRLQAADFDAMDDAELGEIMRAVLRPGAINLQRYSADKGGYPYWHCELYPKDASAETLHRTLLWTIYLNDGFGEGETEFLYQQRKVAPRTGALPDRADGRRRQFIHQRIARAEVLYPAAR